MVIVCLAVARQHPPPMCWSSGLLGDGESEVPAAEVKIL